MSPRMLLISSITIFLALWITASAWAASSFSPSPLIQEIVDAVSVDSFVINVDHLFAFSTRNTVSDTLSDSTGVGAARRWIFDRFSQIARSNGGALIPEYFTFEETVCETFGLHRNVLATLPGSIHPERYFIVGAHFDSRGREECDPVEFAPGANDDGSGTAALLELARVMSPYTFENSVIFMAFTGEEQGLHGSEAYAAYADSLDLDIRGMLNLDTISNAVNAMGRVDSTSYRLYSMGPTGSPHRQLTRLSRWIGAQYEPELEGLVQNAEDRFGRGGDHQPFRRHGFTAIRFIETNENTQEQHNDQDFPENMDPSYGIKVVRTVAAVLANLALAPEKPLPPEVTLNLDGFPRVIWPRINVETDFGGYLLSVRQMPETGPFPDETPFKRVIDVGDVNEFSLEEVIEKVEMVPRYAVSVAAYDTTGAASLFSDEVTSPFEVVPVDSLRVNSRFESL